MSATHYLVSTPDQGKVAASPTRRGADLARAAWLESHPQRASGEYRDKVLVVGPWQGDAREAL